MLAKLLLLFIAVALGEAMVLAEIGARIGWMNTIALMLASALAGMWLFRLEGGRAWRRWQQAVVSGRTPEEGVLSGVLLVTGGVLLVAPGVLTDVVGLALLIPPARRWIARIVEPRLMARFREAGRVRVVHFDAGGPVAWREPGVELLDDGEVHRAEVVGRRVTLRDRAPAEVIDADYEVREPDSERRDPLA